METLKLGATLAVREPQVLLDPTLPPGKYRVTLVLITDRGESEPAQLRLVVREGRTPTPPIGPRDERLDPTDIVRPDRPIPVQPRRPIDVVRRRPSGAVAPAPAAAPKPAVRKQAKAKTKAAAKPRTTKRKPPTRPKGK